MSSVFRVSAPVAAALLALLLPGVGHADQITAWPREHPNQSLAELQERLVTLYDNRPKLEYKLKGAALSLSLEPGSSCTGACLTLAGSF